MPIELFAAFSKDNCIFMSSFCTVTELQKFGAKIQVCGSRAIVSGKGNASLVAEGITEISGISHVDRGYESLEMKLQGLGANVTRTIKQFTIPDVVCCCRIYK
ncbi:hypothetical protein HAX54_010592 [Datura stramonium]|uniref:UDP-N-acetylglucosamine 1-carboxyvinyltransferase n=1 Tax=Datura stramonium TaxID=4076 RepID=A0ABS8TID8_DATST|nr:hypothetical protein [Datura stramonium]